MPHHFALRSEKQGFSLLRDEKPVQTPRHRDLMAPTRQAAEALMREWQALDAQKIDPNKLPLTGFAALAIDLIADQRMELTEELLEFGETDLLFYHEDEQATLRRRQQKLWMPWLEWAVRQMGGVYSIVRGMQSVQQDSRNREYHAAALAKLDNWQLACLMVAVKCSGSLLLGMAFLARALDAEQLHYLSRLEEAYNEERWGVDEEAAKRGAALLVELRNAEQWRDLLLTDPAAAAT